MGHLAVWVARRWLRSASFLGAFCGLDIAGDLAAKIGSEVEKAAGNHALKLENQISS